MQCEVKDVQRVWGLFLQSSSLVVCEVDVGLQEKLKKFRFRKETNNAAILMKIDMEKQLVVLEEEYEVSVTSVLL
ncbi:glia maturation factor gamma [Labeo rohita]|uniref:Glia maturation factor gamma n=1 Tax=Labeo rohita TaxID=84645 RepID=A0A498M867_LABRO|nr:glia maturation factor gamma [Labeo rohita]